MKNLGLILGALLVAIALSNNLFAGPVYAAKWERMLEDGSKQEVLLYGDHHETHEADEELEQQAIDAFCAELKSVKAKTLMLCEDKKDLTCRMVYSDQDFELLTPDFNKNFMIATGLFAHALSNQHMQVESIDPRTVLIEGIPNALDYDMSATLDDRQVIFKKAYEAIKDWNIAQMFNRSINTIRDYSKIAYDQRTGSIFGEIADTLQTRKTVLWNKIFASTGLSLDQLNEATINTIVTYRKSDQKYAKLGTFLTDEPELWGAYSSEAVEAEALWNITGIKNPCSKIVVIAGWSHIRNLEKYLSRLGFVQGDVQGQSYVFADEEARQAAHWFQNVVDAEHSSRVYPLNSLDAFGLNLFQNEFIVAVQKFSSPEVILSNEERQALSSFNAKKEALDSFNPIPFVSFQTFKWISEVELG